MSTVNLQLQHTLLLLLFYTQLKGQFIQTFIYLSIYPSRLPWYKLQSFGDIGQRDVLSLNYDGTRWHCDCSAQRRRKVGKMWNF